MGSPADVLLNLVHLEYFCVINNLPTNHSQNRFCLRQIVNRNLENVLRQHGKISQLTGFQNSFLFFCKFRVSRG